MIKYTVVSQGIAILETMDPEMAFHLKKDSNDEYYDYAQKCEDEREYYADTSCTLYIEEMPDIVRGRSVIDGSIHFGQLIKKDKTYILTSVNAGNFTVSGTNRLSAQLVEVEVISIEYCSCFKDKNEIIMTEGDICSYFAILDNTLMVAPLIWSEPTLAEPQKRILCFRGEEVGHHLEVIGNASDNPELIEQYTPLKNLDTFMDMKF